MKDKQLLIEIVIFTSDDCRHLATIMYPSRSEILKE